MANKFVVSVNYVNQRIDNYLVRELKNIPKSLIYRLLRQKKILVNNKKVKPEYKLLLNDEIKIPNLDGITSKPGFDKNDQIKASQSNLGKALKERIIFECNDFLIINKPAGMAVHAGSGIKSGMIDMLRLMYGKDSYIELVHRLDRETSGCLLIAKNRLALTDLSALFRDGEITKRYVALVKGGWSNSKRLIEHRLRRSVLQGGERMVVVDPVLGKPSTSRIEIKSVHKNTSLLELTPVTGRTHQLRVHVAYEKHPIIGDNKYGDKELNKDVKAKTGLNRMFLHAYNLEFHWGKQHISVQAPFDQDLEKVLKYFDYI